MPRMWQGHVQADQGPENPTNMMSLSPSHMAEQVWHHLGRSLLAKRSAPCPWVTLTDHFRKFVMHARPRVRGLEWPLPVFRGHLVNSPEHISFLESILLQRGPLPENEGLAAKRPRFEESMSLPPSVGMGMPQPHTQPHSHSQSHDILGQSAHPSFSLMGQSQSSTISSILPPQLQSSNHFSSIRAAASSASQNMLRTQSQLAPPERSLMAKMPVNDLAAEIAALRSEIADGTNLTQLCLSHMRHLAERVRNLESLVHLKTNGDKPEHERD